MADDSKERGAKQRVRSVILHLPKVDRLVRPPFKSYWKCSEGHPVVKNEWVDINGGTFSICTLCGVKVRAVDEVD